MRMESRILVVDDERDIADMLEQVLKKDGFDCVRAAYSGRDAIDVCRSFEPDAVVLDIMLPDMDGIEVCRRIRAFSHCSILFLSSQNEDVDKILGLAAGGDDYVTKPFSPKEIVYRIKAQLRRQAFARADARPPEPETLKVGALRLDAAACVAYKADAPLTLTAKEFGLLRFLMENPNRIIGKERLYEKVWGEESAVCDNTIMVHIRHLREKMEDRRWRKGATRRPIRPDSFFGRSTRAWSGSTARSRRRTRVGKRTRRRARTGLPTSRTI